MMGNYPAEKRWSQQFLPEVERLMDANHVSPEAVRCVHVRRNEYLARFGGEFTLRMDFPNEDGETQLSRILDGEGDYLFYGFANEEADGLAAWTIGDLGVFRERVRVFGALPGREVTNSKSGDSAFAVFRWCDFPGMVVAKRGVGGPE